MKRIAAAADEGPNYVFHLAALACAGSRSDYADEYKCAVAAADLETLRRYGGRLDFGFGSGKGGDLASLLVFHPAYLDLASKEAFEEYFGLLDECFASGDYSRFLLRYEMAHDELRNWLFDVDEKWLSSFEASREVLRRLGGVYARGFPGYDSAVWPVESGRMAPVVDRLNKYYRDRDVIGEWERVTGLTFLYPTYRIVLCGALKGGPQANSLGYEKNTFYWGCDFEWMTDFISHEVGTHILVGLARDMTRAGAFDYLAYRAYENLARFYNHRVLGKERLYGMSPQYHCEEFHAVYAEVAGREPGVAPARLFREGLELFRARHPELR